MRVFDVFGLIKSVDEAINVFDCLQGVTTLMPRLNLSNRKDWWANMSCRDLMLNLICSQEYLQELDISENGQDCFTDTLTIEVLRQLTASDRLCSSLKKINLKASVVFKTEQSVLELKEFLLRCKERL